MNKLLQFFTFLPSLKQKTVIVSYISIFLLLIILILMVVTKVISYNDVKYFFWITSILIPLLFTLFITRKPTATSIQENKKLILLLILSFVCLIVTIFSAMLLMKGQTPYNFLDR
ncbi:hypothetical protein DU40_14185 [Methanosarcina mazei]|uniref:Uncharacterized protein n=1 Tax=Methanosarcina mazei TaxID=2209 RepID=A0A0F8C087_METMZ|nr:hypothetical protein DU40_14185 [Methanosarcina mazei]